MISLNVYPTKSWSPKMFIPLILHSLTSQVDGGEGRLEDR